MPHGDPSAPGRGQAASGTRWPYPVRAFLAMPVDSTARTILTAVGLCFVCAILVSAAAVALKPVQEQNRVLDRQRNILQVAGLLYDGADVAAVFAKVEPRAVDLRTGRFTDAVDPRSYDQRAAAQDPAQSIALERGAGDPAGIGRRANIAVVYLVRGTEGQVEKVILPVHGYGLWSTLYGFLALGPDGNTVLGLQFYQHAETPGLGGEVDNPKWRGQWPGKLLFDEAGALRIAVEKGQNAGSAHAVDAISGATLTSVGVHNLVRYWASENGFGPFLRNLPEELANG